MIGTISSVSMKMFPFSIYGDEPGALAPDISTHQVSRITKASILIGIHTTTDTPDLPWDDNLKIVIHVTIVEFHEPRMARIIGTRRR